MPSIAQAQEPVTVGADVFFYGDNTEFSNPFREGETLFGNAARVVVTAGIGDRVTLTGGVFGDQRFGSEHAFEIVRPVIAIEVRTGASRLTFGTFPMPRPAQGPDLEGRHGLLPPIQQETLSFTRAYEAGLQWTRTAPRMQHDAWLDWQRLNTPVGREVFDAGVVGQMQVTRQVAFGYQAHVVHHGGQLHARGAVSDSWVLAPGLLFEARPDAVWRPSFHVYGLVSRYVPDREQQRSTSGVALFTRAAVVRGLWRGHLIVWRGNDYIKEEGDPNYGGLRRDGTRYRKVRDYAEIGLTRTARPAPAVVLEGSARLHRIENQYQYSYRILAFVALAWRVR